MDENSAFNSDTLWYQDNNRRLLSCFLMVFFAEKIWGIILITCYLPTLQHEEPDHPVQVDVLMLPLEEGCSPGEAAQDVIDHLGLRPRHCGKQSQHRGQLEPRCSHVLTRINPVCRLRDAFLGQEQAGAQGGWADSRRLQEENSWRQRGYYKIQTSWNISVYLLNAFICL